MNYITEAFKSLEDINDDIIEEKQPKKVLKEKVEKKEKKVEKKVEVKEEKLNEGFRGCKNVEMIWHGTNNDPELLYVDENGKEYRANYWVVEDSMWEFYEGEHEYAQTHDDNYAKKLNATYDWSSIDNDDDEDFNRFVVNNEDSVISDVIDFSDENFDESKKPSNKKSIKEGVYDDEKYCIDMIHSIMAYGRDFKDGEDLVKEQENKSRNYLDNYINALGRDKVVELADQQVKRPHKIGYAGEDSEGVSYNYLDFLDESKKQVKRKSLKESELINLNDDEEIKKGKEILNSESEEETEQIVDVDADTIDKLKDSYIGNVILQCPVCRTLIYKKPDLLKKDEEDDIYNKDEECPHCGSIDGFELVGQVASLDVEPEDNTIETTGTDMEVKDDVEIKDENEEKPHHKNHFGKMDKEEDSMDIDIDDEDIKFESLDNKKFDRLVNRYAHNVYENFKSYKSTNGKIDEGNGILIVEGVISFKDGKSVKSRFTLNKVTESSKRGLVKFKGVNESFTKGKNAFTLTARVNNKEIVCESLKYNYKAKLNEEFVLVKGKVDNK